MRIRLQESQGRVFTCDQRFRVLVAGRRFGKTFLALTELCRAAWEAGRTAWYVAPTYRQAKRIAWKQLKAMTRGWWAAPPNETDLRIELVNGGTIALRGADNYDSLRGEGLDFVVLDEYACMAPEVWPEVVRPMLSDRVGAALFIGTPKGHNHFYDLYLTAQGGDGWKAFQFTTEQGGLVREEELAAARRELDERTYRQEYQASFEQAGGLTYYAWNRGVNMRPMPRNRELPLVWSLDFNVDLMCSILAQVRPGMECVYGNVSPLKSRDVVEVIDELVIPNNSNTAEVCQALHSRLASWNEWQIRVDIYGDPAGNQRHSSASSRTDWQIVREFFANVGSRYNVEYHLGSRPPKVKDRVNCVNALLRNAQGTSRCFIDPRCRYLIRDLERVQWRADSHGNTLPQLDKTDRTLTHLSDALGYFIEREYGMRAQVGDIAALG
ncbi:MAG TPA: terminase family protein [Terriglobales bacterium]|nr:terminase family protein [Terriglobales bacterium]